MHLISNKEYVLVVERNQAETIYNYYRNFRLHISREGYFYALRSSIAIRKDLNNNSKKQLIKL